MYCKVNFRTLACGEMEPLPARVAGMRPDHLADLSAALGADCPADLADCGYWPAYNRPPDYDPLTHALSGDYSLTVDAGAKTVWRQALVRPLAPEEIAAAAANSRSALKTAVKAEAARRILAVAPDWKQRNLTARAAELALRGQPFSAAEQAEITAGQAIWAAIKAVRVASGEIEAAIDACDDPAALAAWDVAAGWPNV